MRCTCCTLDDGSPCSSTFSLEEYLYHRSDAAGLSRNELDMVLMGSLMTFLGSNEAHDKNHHPKNREKDHIIWFGGRQFCKLTYMFLLGVGKDRLRNVKIHYQENGATVENSHTMLHHSIPFRISSDS